MIRPRIFCSIRQAIRKALLFSLARILPASFLLDKRHFKIWEKRGYHITPIHFYSPIPDTRELNNEVFKRRSTLKGIKINEKMQLELLAIFSKAYKVEYDRFPREKTSNPNNFYLENGAFGSVDAEILYSFVRYFKPRMIYEVGSGFSTLLFAKAILQNKEDSPLASCSLYSFEPYPGEMLKKGFPGLTKLVEKKVQDIQLGVF